MGAIVFSVLLVAGFSLGLALILDTQAANMGWRRRALYAALGGAFIPTLIPTITLLTTGGWSAEIIIAVLALLIGALLLAGIVGFPITYWFCRRREAARGSLDPAKEFE